MPAVIAPSPITAIVCFLLTSSLLAKAMPSAAPKEVLECPTPNTSYSLSALEGKGAKPSLCLTLSISFFLPVRIL